MSAQQSPIPNPLDTLRRRQRVLWVMGVPIIAGFAWWALHPVPRASDLRIDSLHQEEQPSRQHAIDARPPPAIDSAIFAINLWSAPPQAAQQEMAEAPPPPPPPPPPLNIQLIGIITEAHADGSSIQKAALYDVDSDRLLIVADGERVGDHRVRVLAGGIVELSDGRTTRRLTLRPDDSGGGAG